MMVSNKSVSTFNKIADERAAVTRQLANSLRDEMLHVAGSLATKQRDLVLENKRKFPYRGFVDVSADCFQTFVMFCNNDDPVALQYFWLGADAWEPTSMRIWSSLCRNARGAVLDIGSFSGLYSLVANGLCTMPIVAFEPSRMPLVRLIDNINANGASAIKVVPKAASDHEGITCFHLLRGLMTLSTGGRLEGVGDEGLQEPVFVTTVDQELEALNIGTVSHAKIDVEANEVRTLKGMWKMIERDRPELLIEIIPDLLGEVSGMLGRIGYHCLAIEEEQQVLLRLEDAPRKDRNYLFSARPECLNEMASLVRGGLG